MDQLISIIVPVYNAAEYIGRCAQSVLQQSYTAWELILVDNASTDGSDSICIKIANQHPDKVRFISEPRSGVSIARNTGIRHARGRYVTFADADDELAPGALALLAEVARFHPECGIVMGQMTHTRPRHLSQQASDIKIVDSLDAIASTLYQEPWTHPSATSKLYKAGLVRDMFVEGRRYEDLESFARVYLNAGKIAIIPEHVYFYRQNSGSFTHQWSENRLDALWAVDTLRDFAEPYPTLRGAAVSRSFSAYYNMFILAGRNDRREVAARCYAYIKAHRATILRDRRVRLKNKIGAILSYGGAWLLRLVTTGRF